MDLVEVANLKLLRELYQKYAHRKEFVFLQVITQVPNKKLPDYNNS